MLSAKPWGLIVDQSRDQLALYFDGGFNYSPTSMPCKPSVIVRLADVRMMPEPDSQFAPFDSALPWWYETTGDARTKETSNGRNRIEFYLPSESNNRTGTSLYREEW
jgi:hypothetical protein